MLQPPVLLWWLLLWPLEPIGTKAPPLSEAMARVSAATPAELESSPGELLAEEGATPAAADAIDAEDLVSLSRLRRCEVGRGGSSPHLVPPPPPPPPPPPVLLLLDADADDADGDDLAAPPPSKPPGARLLPLPRRTPCPRASPPSGESARVGDWSGGESIIIGETRGETLGDTLGETLGDALGDVWCLGLESRDDDELARRRRAREEPSSMPRGLPLRPKEEDGDGDRSAPPSPPPPPPPPPLLLLPWWWWCCWSFGGVVVSMKSCGLTRGLTDGLTRGLEKGLIRFTGLPPPGLLERRAGSRLDPLTRSSSVACPVSHDAPLRGCGIETTGLGG